MRKITIMVDGTTSLEEIQKLLNIAPANRRTDVKHDRRDPDEEHDDIPRKDKNPYVAGLCEIAGLVHRARVELAEKRVHHAMRTLGRVANAIDSTIN